MGRALAFGDLGSALWGVAWMPDGDSRAPLAVCAASDAAVIAVELQPGASPDLGGEEAGEPWRLEAPEVSLVLSPSGSGGRGRSPDGRVEVADQLCRVSGRLRLEQREHEVDCMGWRGALRGDVELARIESLRLLSAWFDPDAGLSLISLRPARSRGQEADIIAASALEPEPAPPVADPRLSTTYTEAGVPTRAGLELWPAEETADEADPGSRAYPRRAAAEAVGAGVDWESHGFVLHAELLRWHSRGRDGTGIYLLGHRR
jgi:hypothetical protein